MVGIDEAVLDNWHIMRSEGLSEDETVKAIAEKMHSDPDLSSLCHSEKVGTDLEFKLLVNGRAMSLHLITPTPTYGPDSYFDERTQRFQPGKLAKDIARQENIITIRDMGEEIVYLKDGIYHKGDSGKGDSYLRGRLKEIMGNRLEDLSQHAINELITQVRLNTYAEYRIFESDIELLPVKNGGLDLIAGTITPYEPGKHHFLFQLPVVFDPEADCPHIKEFLSEVLHEKDIPVVQEIFGYCLWREYYIKKAIMMVGDGDNGKSILMDLLGKFLGSGNTSAISLTQLSDNRFSTSYLRDKLANIFADLPDKAVRDTGLFKMLTGGDLVPYEIKHGGIGQFRNYAKLLFSTNTIPDARDDKGAYFGRWLLLEFPYAFVKKSLDHLLPNERLAKDRDSLLKELTTRMELSGLLNFALIGLKRLRENGRFSDDRTSDEIKRQYIRMSNSLKAFIEEGCIIGPNNEVPKSGGVGSFYTEYMGYCEENRLAKKDASTVGRDIIQISSIISAGRSRRFATDGKAVPIWHGIRLKTDADSDTEEEEESGGLDDFGG